MRKIFRNFCLPGFGDPTLVVENGRIVALEDGPLQLACERLDLGGGWLAPAFIDSHCHILPTGLDLVKLDLRPFNEPFQVLDAIRDRLREATAGQWLQAVGYDQTRFADRQHLTRDDLDSLSSDTPISLRHVNGHASVVNSAALEAADVGEDVTDPPGGEFGRDAGGRLSGLLLERAHEHVSSCAPEPSLEEMVQAILLAARAMSSFGITSASDMMTGRWHLMKELEAYRVAAERGSPVRFVLFLQWSEVLGPRAAPRHVIEEQVARMDPSTCAVGGLKIFADGAIGSATAAIYGAYAGDPADGRTTSGKLIYRPERLNHMVRIATERGHRVAIHAIGDWGVDVALDAFEASGEPRLHRLEHAMILSDDQINRIHRVGCPVALQPEFLHRFGHAYVAQLGPERASRLKRARSLIDAGVPVAFNSDRPIVLGDPWVGMSTAVHRPDGFDSRENVTWGEAFAAYTREGAAINGQAHQLGKIQVGALADWAAYSSDPRVSRPETRTHLFKGGSIVD